MSGKTKEKNTQTNTLDPEYHALVYGAADRARGLADSYTPYGGPRVAGFSPIQLEAQTGLANFARSNAGAPLMHQAADVAGGAAGYQPINIDPSMIAASAIDPKRLSGADLSGYLNPYIQQVVDTSAADIQRQRDIALNQAKAQALKAGAWGGTGGAVLSGQVSDNYDRNLAQTIAGLRSAGYDKAVAGAQFDLGNDLEAQRSNQAAQLSALQSNQATGLSAQQANQAAGLQAAGLRLNAAGVLGDLSDRERAQAIQDWGILSSVGDTQQAQQQREYDAAAQAFADDWQQRMALAQLYNGAVGGVPMTGTVNGTRTVTQSPGLGDVLKTAATVGSAVATGGASLGLGGLGGLFAGGATAAYPAASLFDTVSRLSNRPTISGY